ncbi:MAG: Gamma-glutamyltranspeptidase @ Glutathione hydrolase [uncultured Sphingosinicella sp.]|uniref:Gamma-glutamyltranspeptidase @ Glutathione hydrolase n=1 Tax=uncultured Sphingosinicella sp. TaxID=478748 RepID=A0A6J4TE88_9SPHN|nr:gamma-glutamyltransferase family protein [uncultured Sphingosinicella sp.]CAA9521161.1 MAG: Gamma-glutamyltranspeptidase @ Glutathione hydrolase [uncultured Sphingosinicella sp.]
MKRRTFLAAAPVAVVGLSVARGSAAQTGGAVEPLSPALPATQFYPDVEAGDRPVGASFGTRSEVFGRNGAAATSHPLGTLAGIEILKKGGSAVDAAIAINAALGFLEPTANGIGGDLYAMLWDPKASRVVGIAGSGRSPRALDLATVQSRARGGILPNYGAVTVTVPGTVDAWWRLHQRYGKLRWAELFEPAIAYAEGGVPLSPVVAYYMNRAMANYARPNMGIEEIANAQATYASGDRARAGEIFRNPDLARTYRLIAKGGRDAFYEGEIARTVEAYFKRIGGWMTRADLAAHQSEWSEPVATTYRGVTVHAIGANTQGIATLQMLNMLETMDMKAAGFQTPMSIHLQAEAKRLAYEDRARYYADPNFSRIPTEWLVSKDYAAQRAKLIRPDRINPTVAPGQAPSQGDTTYFAVADRNGMMVSLIQSNFRGMGSGLVGDGLGFMFHDRGQLFTLQEGHPNMYAPGKRPFQTIIPGFATRDGKPWLSFGVMGGDMQPQGQAQIILNRVDYGLDGQAAGDSPRWHHEGSSEQMGEDDKSIGGTGLLRLESGVPERTARTLAEMGWRLGPSDGGFGRYSSVERRESGGALVYAAAADVRADGMGLAY